MATIPTSPKEEQERRMAICKACEFYATDRPDWCTKDNSCAHCKWEDNADPCPENKWAVE